MRIIRKPPSMTVLSAHEHMSIHDDNLDGRSFSHLVLFR